MTDRERIIGYIRSENIKLDTTIKEKWITALRSGDYEQTQGWLNLNSCYCCLGVLAQIHGISKTGSIADNTGDVFYDFHFPHGEDYNCSLPPDSFGLSDVVQSSLAELNDAGMSFEEIADIIEEYL